MKENKYIQKGIIKTLSYAQVFEYPLTLRELYTYFIADLPISSKELQYAIETLLIKGIIKKEGNYYYLPGYFHLVAQRRSRQQFSQKKLGKAQAMASILSRIPTIQFIGVSGSLSMKNAAKNDDIDFFIITQRNCLWITRFLSVVLCSRVGRRRSRNEKEVKDRICLNMFVSEDALCSQKKNVFIAHEIAQVFPLLNRNNIYERFLRNNKWIVAYLPHIVIPEYSHSSSSLFSRFFFVMIQPIEAFFYLVQYLYMKSHISQEVVTLTEAKFHPKDNTQRVIKKYKKIYQSNSLKRDDFAQNSSKSRLSIDGFPAGISYYITPGS